MMNTAQNRNLLLTVNAIIYSTLDIISQALDCRKARREWEMPPSWSERSFRARQRDKSWQRRKFKFWKLNGTIRQCSTLHFCFNTRYTYIVTLRSNKGRRTFFTMHCNGLWLGATYIYIYFFFTNYTDVQLGFFAPRATFKAVLMAVDMTKTV